MTDQDLDALLVKAISGYKSVFGEAREAADLTAGFIDTSSWKVGEFHGWPRLQWLGPRDYVFIFENDPNLQFSYTDSNGVTITPEGFPTDGGSIPRAAWCIEGFSPWDYLPAYIIHDWDFYAHRCGMNPNRTFIQANQTLFEGIWTLMKSGKVDSSPWRVRIIFQAVSLFSRPYWDGNNPGQAQ